MKIMTGCVRFPTNDPAFENTNEGGMVVKLVVVDAHRTGGFDLCCGAFVRDVMSESLVGDDLRDKSAFQEEADPFVAQEAKTAWEAYHFPRIANGNGVIERFLSRDYLAVVVLGSTTWSGWHKTEERYWACRFDDLTNEGKALYEQIKNLYRGCDLHLLTFLDT